MLRAPTGTTGSYTGNRDGVRRHGHARHPDVHGQRGGRHGHGPGANPWASETPAAPTSVAFQPATGQGTSTVTSANNSSGPNELKFTVTGVTVRRRGDGLRRRCCDRFGRCRVNHAVGQHRRQHQAAGWHAYHHGHGDRPECCGDLDRRQRRSSRDETANVDSLSSPGIQLQVVTSLAVTSTPATTASVGVSYTYQVTTNAPSGDTITVTPGTLPSGMTFDASTQTFTWRPLPRRQARAVVHLHGHRCRGQHHIAANGECHGVGSHAHRDFEAPPTTATVGVQYSYQVTTSAASTDTITVAAASGTTLPAGMQVTGQTVTWTPTAAQEGTTQSFTLTVTDTTLGGTATIGPTFIAVSAASGITVLVPPTTMAVGSPVLVGFNDTVSGATYTVSTSVPAIPAAAT